MSNLLDLIFYSTLLYIFIRGEKSVLPSKYEFHKTEFNKLVKTFFISRATANSKNYIHILLLIIVFWWFCMN
jgi:hypothetical protein